MNQGWFSWMCYGLREVMEQLVQTIGGKWKLTAWKQLRGASRVALVVKILPASAGDAGDMGSVPGWGRSPGGGYGNPLQYSCLGNPMDRGPWRATVHGAAKSQARLKWLSTHTCKLYMEKVEVERFYLKLTKDPFVPGPPAINKMSGSGVKLSGFRSLESFWAALCLPFRPRKGKITVKIGFVWFCEEFCEFICGSGH